MYSAEPNNYQILINRKETLNVIFIVVLAERSLCVPNGHSPKAFMFILNANKTYLKYISNLAVVVNFSCVVVSIGFWTLKKLIKISVGLLYFPFIYSELYWGVLFYSEFHIKFEHNVEMILQSWFCLVCYIILVMHLRSSFFKTLCWYVGLLLLFSLLSTNCSLAL